MKITKSGLKKLIKEELEKTLNEKQARHMGQMRAEMVRALSEAIDLGGLENRPSQSTKLNRFMDPIVELFKRVEELESDEPEYLRGPLPVREALNEMADPAITVDSLQQFVQDISEDFGQPGLEKLDRLITDNFYQERAGIEPGPDEY